MPVQVSSHAPDSMRWLEHDSPRGGGMDGQRAAMAMALAIRARMINAAPEQLSQIALDLAADSLQACIKAERQRPPVGHG